MAITANWVRRRWLDFRQGHSIYLVFLMTFANFITIQYALLVDRVPALKDIFSNLWIFALVFVVGYIPIAIAVGNWHRKSQWKVEQEAIFSENIVQAKMWLFLLELIEGSVTDEKKKEMRKMLKQIIKKDTVSKKEVVDNTKEKSMSLEQRKEDAPQ